MIAVNVNLNTPSVRALLAAGAAAAALFAAKPPALFTVDGRPRLARYAARDDQLADAVLVPWYGVVLGVGAAVLLFT